MYILYYLPTCPYCRKVIDYMEGNGITADMRDITEQEHADALVERGGKRQVPFLVDADRSVSMYESDAIIEHLAEHREG